MTTLIKSDYRVITYAWSTGQDREKVQRSRDSSLWVNSFSWMLEVPVLSSLMRRINRLACFGVFLAFSVIIVKNPGFLLFGPIEVLGRWINMNIMNIISHGADLLCIQASKNQRCFVSVVKTTRYDMKGASKNYSTVHTHSEKKNPNHDQTFSAETFLQMKAFEQYSLTGSRS